MLEEDKEKENKIKAELRREKQKKIYQKWYNKQPRKELVAPNKKT